MSEELFQANNPDTLGQRMSQQWASDLLTIARDGRVANWIELEQIVTKDEIAFMRLIEDSAGYTVPDTRHTVNYGTDKTELGLEVDISRNVDHLTYTLGFTAPGNCAAMVNRTLEKGYVIRGECAITGRVRYTLGEIGRYMLSLKEREDMYDQD